MKKNTNRYSAYYFPIGFILLGLWGLQCCTQPAKNNTKHEKPELLIPLPVSQTNEPETKEILQKIMPDKKTIIGKPDKSVKDSILVTIPSQQASRKGMLMHKEAFEAFKEMHSAAMDDGVELRIISAYRDFSHQKRIWENKWNGIQVLSGNIDATTLVEPNERALEILKYSAMPGTSRHHWGTDIDINSLNNIYFEHGKGKEEYEWLVGNAHKFGFCQPYTPRNQRGDRGYEEEKWHWSYMPVASGYLKAYIDSVTYTDLQGFDGWETAQTLNAIENFVLTIDQKCLDY